MLFCSPRGLSRARPCPAVPVPLSARLPLSVLLFPVFAVSFPRGSVSAFVPPSAPTRVFPSPCLPVPVPVSPVPLSWRFLSVCPAVLLLPHRLASALPCRSPSGCPCPAVPLPLPVCPSWSVLLPVHVPLAWLILCWVSPPCPCPGPWVSYPYPGSWMCFLPCPGP